MALLSTPVVLFCNNLIFRHRGYAEAKHFTRNCHLHCINQSTRSTPCTHSRIHAQRSLRSRVEISYTEKVRDWKIVCPENERDFCGGKSREIFTPFSHYNIHCQCSSQSDHVLCARFAWTRILNILWLLPKVKVYLYTYTLSCVCRIKMVNGFELIWIIFKLSYAYFTWLEIEINGF